ncbi:MBL fold metallo-hydrolase [Pengzhenrongella frigida]|uniref:MBL fold metallo-hydrolase n=1 Tax=Pengzhenrongella frigida TaxID=1259133 RepID=A0A4Q5N387_9MICO|nr:MBL fold metallo-hydrolase [Cellulomonas sp. HLT2-17]RYV52615.1 MBL fold metallo-hydrolase [Cellulomonas sp. HLT2-17]
MADDAPGTAAWASSGPPAAGRPAAPMRELTEVAPGVWTATAEIWTSLTTVVVGDDGACLVVDPGITVAEVAALARAIRDRGWSVAAGFSTHPHWDHLLWAAELGDGPRWATRRGAEHALADRPDVLAKTEAAAPGHDRDLTGMVQPLPDGASTLPWDGPRVVVVGHEAHCPGHAGLVIPHAGVLLAGDMLSDLEIPLLDVEAVDPIGDYRTALDALESAAREHGVDVLVPGHGHVGNAAELARRLQADRAYLDGLVAGRTSTDPRLALPAHT